MVFLEAFFHGTTHLYIPPLRSGIARLWVHPGRTPRARVFAPGRTLRGPGPCGFLVSAKRGKRWDWRVPRHARPDQRLHHQKISIEKSRARLGREGMFRAYVARRGQLFPSDQARTDSFPLGFSSPQNGCAPFNLLRGEKGETQNGKQNLLGKNRKRAIGPPLGNGNPCIDFIAWNPRTRKDHPSRHDA